MRIHVRTVIGLLLTIGTAAAWSQTSMSLATMQDKIKGGWVGQVAGVCWGGPTEFRWNNALIPDNKIPAWTPSDINSAFNGLGDDLYVEIPFLDAMLANGVNCHWQKFGDQFAATTFELWHANKRGRDNLRDGLPLPWSGHYRNNCEYDDLDYQIEADYAGIIAPGLPMAAAEIAWRGGHAINWGNGVYAGVFVAAMHARAYTATSIADITQAGRLSIPYGTKFRTMIEDCFSQKNSGQTFTQAWTFITQKYRRTTAVFADADPDDDCNYIDANQNSAYILLGLLYGNGNFEESMRLSMKCGADSDCNPSSVGGILGNYYGLAGIPDKFKSAINYNLPYPNSQGTTLQHLINRSEVLARQIVRMAGGAITGSGASETWVIPAQTIVTAPFEQCEVRDNDPRQPIHNPAPVLTATVTGIAGLQATFSASATDADGIKEYTWFFGDLTFARGATVSHTYASNGVYQVTAYASDNKGYTAFKILTISLNPALPVQPTDLKGSAGSNALVVSWTAASTNETGFTLLWSTNNTAQNGGDVNLPAGRTNHIITGLTAGTTYYFKIKSTNAFGTLNYTEPASAAIERADGAWLSGSVASRTANANLTAEGTADWLHCDFAGSQPSANVQVGRITRKNIPTKLILDYVRYGGVKDWVDWYNNDSTRMLWSDGQPPRTNTSYIKVGHYAYSSGSGFRWTAPADPSTRIMKIYCGAWQCDVRLTAHLSDGSAPDYVYTFVGTTNGLGKTYTLMYRAATSGQTLNVSIENVRQHYGRDDNNVALAAITLAEGPPLPTGLSATPTSVSQVNLSWTDPATSETGFRVHWSTNQTAHNGDYMELPANTTSCGVTSLKPGTLYYFKLKAVNDDGDSGYGTPVSATTMPTTADLDGDGMPDGWELAMFGGTTTTGGGAAEDKDGDGVVNRDEYIVGSSPIISNTPFGLMATSTNGQLVLSYPTVEASGPGYEFRHRYYDLQSTENLFSGNWQGVGGETNVGGNNAVHIYTTSLQSSLQFYRSKVRVQ